MGRLRKRERPGEADIGSTWKGRVKHDRGGKRISFQGAVLKTREDG